MSSASFEQLFTAARTPAAYLDKPVSAELLEQIYNLAKWGATSMNCQPLRLLFVTSREGKEKLRPALMAGNVDKVLHAPVTAIFAYDQAFYENLPAAFPHFAGARDMFANNAALARSTASRNGALQAAYFMLAARALGLDCGPMSGIDAAAIDAAFFAGTTLKTDFICSLGYADTSKTHPRNARLGFEQVAKFA